jgi:hypothetical protein
LSSISPLRSDSTSFHKAIRYQANAEVDDGYRSVHVKGPSLKDVSVAVSNMPRRLWQKNKAKMFARAHRDRCAQHLAAGEAVGRFFPRRRFKSAKTATRTPSKKRLKLEVVAHAGNLPTLNIYTPFRFLSPTHGSGPSPLSKARRGCLAGSSLSPLSQGSKAFLMFASPVLASSG